jgi:glycosyltransferase involved in cell wall biosynthesis
MKILIRQFLGKNHSWSVIGWNLATSLINKGHQVHLFSTDGIIHLPDHLRPYLLGYWEENKMDIVHGRLPDPTYDCQLSYTSMKNFPAYLRNGSKNRFGIWCYEWAGKNVLPNGFAKHYRSCDKLLPPSTFAKNIFLDSGIPDSAMQIIPHGVSQQFISGTDFYPLKTDKRFKVLCCIAQPHERKNIPGILEAWGKAFTNQDDVVLVMKVVNKKPSSPFEVDFNQLLTTFKKKYPQHGEILVIDKFIEDLSPLYRACNAFLSLSLAECFLIPALEALVSGKIVIVSGHGGQTDFCTEESSLLVSGQIVRANPRGMYWEPKMNATVFRPSEEVAATQLQKAYREEEELLQKFAPAFEATRQKYTWDNVAQQIMDLCV